MKLNSCGVGYLLISASLCSLIGGCKKSVAEVLVANSQPMSTAEMAVPVAILGVASDDQCSPKRTTLVPCTGVRVSEHFVATAAHCVANLQRLYVLGDSKEHIRFFNGRQDPYFACVVEEEIRQLQTALRIQKSDVFTAQGGADVALIRVRQPISHPVVPAGSYRKHKPSQVWILGLGRNTCVTGEPGKEEVSGFSRNQISFGKVTLTPTNAVSPDGEQWYVGMKSGTVTQSCAGDSGSGVFANVGGKLLVFGVLSRTVSDFSVANTTDFFLDFSDNNVARFFHTFGVEIQ